MALADIARFDENQPISLRDISLRQGISINYLEQLFLKLKKNNIVKSIRGKKGGYVYQKVQKILIYLIYFLLLKKRSKQLLAKNIQRIVAMVSQQNVSLIICGTNWRFT